MHKPCKLCGNANYKILIGQDAYNIIECNKCGLVKTDGQLSVNYKQYHRDEVYDEYEDYFRNIFKKRYNIISQYKKSAEKILDIGAATGTLLSIFKDNGWEVWGVEPSKSATIAGKKGIKIIKENFEMAILPKNYFDVVIMNHTLEHVDDPVAVLRKINTILKKNGIVYIDVPNFGSLSRQIAGKDWKYLLPQEHVHHFTPKTLKKCIKKSGFSIVWWKTWSGIYDVANPILKFWQTLTRGKKQFFTDLIEIPGNIVATSLNLGTSLAVIGKKL